MHFCYESEKTIRGPICSRILALYHQNNHYQIRHGKNILKIVTYDDSTEIGI